MADVTQVAVTAVGILAASGLTVYQLRRSISPRRTRLKHDLEILKLARELDLSREHLEADVRQQVETLYGDAPTEWKPKHVAMIVYALTLFIGFGVWTVYLVRDHFTWWAVLTGLFAFGGLGPMMELIMASSGSSSSENTATQPPTHDNRSA